jgi:hypothetical protein
LANDDDEGGGQGAARDLGRGGGIKKKGLRLKGRSNYGGWISGGGNRTQLVNVTEVWKGIMMQGSLGAGAEEDHEQAWRGDDQHKRAQAVGREQNSKKMAEKAKRKIVCDFLSKLTFADVLHSICPERGSLFGRYSARLRQVGGWMKMYKPSLPDTQ